MNTEHFNIAIRAIEWAIENEQELDMDTFQSNDLDHYILEREEFVHNCGSTACFAGYVALSPEFQTLGGYVSGTGGAPHYQGEVCENAMALFLDIDLEVSEALCGLGYEEIIYGSDEVTLQKIVDILHEMKDNGGKTKDWDEKYTEVESH